MLTISVPYRTALFPRLYTPPTLFGLTGNPPIDYILAEIPFFSVGLLAFAILTFFLLLRRLNAGPCYLFGSAIVGFAAAILDLVKVLALSHKPGKQSSELQNLFSLIVAREIGFAASIGLRFYFFWYFVADIPPGDIPPPASNEKRPNFISYNSDRSEITFHSGAWGRWGPFGILLKILLLAITIAIPVLQIIWRIVTALSKFGPIYEADATLQIVGSGIFILKLLLNTSLVPDGRRLIVFGNYTVVIAALGINLGLGIGNLLCFAFSETVLGRFLQAVELYILILFVLVSTFWRPAPPDTNGSSWVRRVSSFRELPFPVDPRATVFHVSPPDMSARSPSIIEGGGPSVENGRPVTNRQSSAQRVSSWLQNRGISTRLRDPIEGDGERLWKREEAWRRSDAERRPTDPEVGLSPGSMSGSVEASPTGISQDANWRDPMLTSVIREGRPPTADYDLEKQPPGSVPVSALPAPVEETVVIGRNSTNVVASDRRSETRSRSESVGALSAVPTMPSFYAPSVNFGPETAPPPDIAALPASAAARGQIDSPIYGLDGVINNLQQRVVTESPRPSSGATNDNNDGAMSGVPSSRSSGISQLLRQQQELDKSIAQLRLFTRSPEDPNRASVKPESMSVQSEFSLSNFPAPPWDTSKGEESQVTSRRSSTTIRKSVSVGNIVFDMEEPLEPPQMPSAMEHRRTGSFPMPVRMSSESDDNVTAPGRSRRASSQGTGYNVTSFIADRYLAAPGQGGSPVASPASSGPSRLTDIESADEINVTTATVVTLGSPTSTKTARPVVVESPPQATESDALRIALAEEEEAGDRGAPFPLIRPPAASRSDMPSLAPGMAHAGPSRGLGRGGRVGLPPRPRISGPKRSGSSDTQMSYSPGAYERPRPAPSIS